MLFNDDRRTIANGSRFQLELERIFTHRPLLSRDFVLRLPFKPVPHLISQGTRSCDGPHLQTAAAKTGTLSSLRLGGSTTVASDHALGSTESKPKPARTARCPTSPRAHKDFSSLTCSNVTSPWPASRKVPHSIWNPTHNFTTNLPLTLMCTSNPLIPIKQVLSCNHNSTHPSRSISNHSRWPNIR